MSATDADRLARLALSRLVEPGDPRVGVLVDELGATELHARLAGDRGPEGVQDDVVARLAEIDPVRDLEVGDRLGLRYVVPGDEEWPAGLADLADAAPVQERGGPPLGLWVRGPLRLDALGPAAAVAVVGSRSATSYGADVAAELGAGLARTGHPVVSGAAFGIDQAAHRGALAVEGPTVAVLACGADRVYPAAHTSLINAIAATGAIVSELAPGCAPTRMRFLSRNRLIAALTRGTVIVEAALRSGALNTANWAGRLHRPLMGVPGPVTSAPSQGVHQLLREGAATLVTGPEEVLELVGSAGEGLLERERGPDGVRDRLTPRQRQVLDAVPVARPASSRSIARTAGIGLVEVGSALAGLRRHGLVADTDDGWVLTAEAR